MKITVNRKELIQVLKRLSSVIPGRTTLPVLHHALVDVNKLGIWFRATDLDQWISVRISGKPEGYGLGLFPVKKLEKAVKTFTGEKVSINFLGDQDAPTGSKKTQDFKVLLRCGKTRFETDTRPVEDFPKNPETKSLYSFEIDPALLVSIIKKTAYAISVDLTRPALCGVLFRVEKDKLTTVATDGHRLSLVKTSSFKSHDVKKVQDVIVRDKTLRVLKDYADQKGSLWAHIGEKWIQFSSYDEEGQGLLIVTCMILEGPFPKFENVIPQNTVKSFSSSREDLLGSVKRISVFSDVLTHQVKLEIKKTKVTLVAETRDTGKASEDLKCTGTGSFEVGYNALYLEQALETLENEEVKISMEGNDRAGLIEEQAGDLEHMVILMPLSLEG